MGLWFSNSAYVFLSVSLFQMLKALIPIAVYLIVVSLKKEAYKGEPEANMLAISIGVTISAYGEAKMNAWEVILQLSAVACETTQLVLIQIPRTSKGIKLNPITSLLLLVALFFSAPPGP